MGKRVKEIVSFNMSRIRSSNTKLEARLEGLLTNINSKFEKHPQIFGNPDFAYIEGKIAIFADSDFWHGYDWEHKKLEIKTNKDFWIKKIERNMQRDIEVTTELRKEGWEVIRLWGHDILKHPEKCKEIVKQELTRKNMNYFLEKT